VHIVVPVRVSHLHFLTDDESKERQEAEQTVSISVGLLEKRCVSTTGSVGSDKPLESMTDALGFFPATDVLLATPPEERRRQRKSRTGSNETCWRRHAR
jgi:hypothetical protein